MLAKYGLFTVTAKEERKDYLVITNKGLDVSKYPLCVTPTITTTFATRRIKNETYSHNYTLQVLASIRLRKRIIYQ